MRTVGRFGNLRQRRRVDLAAQSVEMAEAHDEWTPPVGIDPVFVAVHAYRLGDVHADYADLDGDQSSSAKLIALGETMTALQNGL